MTAPVILGSPPETLEARTRSGTLFREPARLAQVDPVKQTLRFQFQRLTRVMGFVLGPNGCGSHADPGILVRSVRVRGVEQLVPVAERQAFPLEHLILTNVMCSACNPGDWFEIDIELDEHVEKASWSVVLQTREAK